MSDGINEVAIRFREELAAKVLDLEPHDGESEVMFRVRMKIVVAEEAALILHNDDAFWQAADENISAWLRQSGTECAMMPAEESPSGANVAFRLAECDTALVLPLELPTFEWEFFSPSPAAMARAARRFADQAEAMAQKAERIALEKDKWD